MYSVLVEEPLQAVPDLSCPDLVCELVLQRSPAEIEAIAVLLSGHFFKVVRGIFALAEKDTGCKARVVYISFYRQLKA